MMGSIIPFRASYQRNNIPPIIFVEMFQERFDAYAALSPRAHTVLRNCRALIDGARALGFPVAFAISKSRALAPEETSKSWLDGFRPQRDDMIFEPLAASCYSSPEFAETMSDIGGHFVLAGFMGESICLATAIDAAAFGHRAGLIEDALSTQPIFGEPLDSHRVVVGTASRYATILMLADWLPNARPALAKLEVPRAFQQRA